MTTTETSTAALEKSHLTLGFIPLSDCAPLVIAREKGFFANHGLDVRLSKEQSWANLRDKLAVGMLDGAQMLATMPLTNTLGIGPIQNPTLTAMVLDLNGNAITVADGLYQRMQAIHPACDESPLERARALKKLIRQQHDKLTFAVVFPSSTHSYELRYWMAAVGIDVDRDIRMVVIPPQQMVDALEAGSIDGYCAGEPWNSLAVRDGIGRVVATKYEIWNNSPEKVFGVNEAWAEQYPQTHKAVISALLEACRWVDLPENRAEVVDTIAQPKYVNAPRDVVRMSMMGTFQMTRTEFPQSMPDFNVFHRYAANFPWRSQAAWFITQMYRWGHLQEVIDIRATAERVYRSDIFREVAAPLGIRTPVTDYKSEGSHNAGWQLDNIDMGADQFIDRYCFYPDSPLTNLSEYEVCKLAVPEDALQAMNPDTGEAQKGAA